MRPITAAEEAAMEDYLEREAEARADRDQQAADRAEDWLLRHGDRGVTSVLVAVALGLVLAVGWRYGGVITPGPQLDTVLTIAALATAGGLRVACWQVTL